MWWPLIAAGLGYLIGSSGGDSSEPEAPERMDYSEALKQAEKAMKPQYEKARARTLSDVDRNLISRGFYGQAPGDAFKARTMADMESDYQGQLSSAATNLQNQQYMQDYQVYQTELQQRNQQGQQMDPMWQMLGYLGGSFLGGSGGDSLFNWLLEEVF